MCVCIHRTFHKFYVLCFFYRFFAELKTLERLRFGHFLFLKYLLQLEHCLAHALGTQYIMLHDWYKEFHFLI